MAHQGTIVIIEDEQILLDVISKKLEQEGYLVRRATDGEAGLAAVAAARPDLILLDILMPKMDGYEVLTALRARYGEENMPPIIVISNSGQPVEIDKVMNLGAKDYIIKAQFTPQEVVQKVKKFIRTTPMQPPSTAPANTDPASGLARHSDAGGSATKILVVEDDQFLRELLNTKLQKEKFNVVTAIDGPDGVEKILKERPDIVLLDIILPGVDGFEILKRVRSNSVAEIAKIPVILLSNLGQEADVEKGRSLGADDYLIKSNFTIDEIIEKVQRILSKKS